MFQLSCRFMAVRKCAINACINYSGQLNGAQTCWK